MTNQLENRIRREKLSSFGEFLLFDFHPIRAWKDLRLYEEFHDRLNEALEREKIELRSYHKKSKKVYFKSLFERLKPQLYRFKQKKSGYSIDATVLTLKEKWVLESNPNPNDKLGIYLSSISHGATNIRDPAPKGYEFLISSKNPKLEQETRQFDDECAKQGFPRPNPKDYNLATYPGTNTLIDNKWLWDFKTWEYHVALNGILNPTDSALVYVKLFPESTLKK